MSYKPDGFDNAVGCAVLICDIPYRGWVASLLWGWFIVPLGLPAIGFWQMLGVLTMLGILFRYHAPKQTAEDASDWYGRVAAGPVYTTFSLVFGVILRGLTP